MKRVKPTNELHSDYIADALTRPVGAAEAEAFAAKVSRLAAKGELQALNTYKPTHRRVRDGSEAQIIDMTTDGERIILRNESGDEDVYSAAEWQPIDYSEHNVTLHRTLTTSVDVVADADGNAQIVESGGENVVDYIESHLVCDVCGPLYDSDSDVTNLYQAHGFSDEWCES